MARGGPGWRVRGRSRAVRVRPRESGARHPHSGHVSGGDEEGSGGETAYPEVGIIGPDSVSRGGRSPQAIKLSDPRSRSDRRHGCVLVSRERAGPSPALRAPSPGGEGRRRCSTAWTGPSRRRGSSSGRTGRWRPRRTPGRGRGGRARRTPRGGGSARRGGASARAAGTGRGSGGRSRSARRSARVSRSSSVVSPRPSIRPLLVRTVGRSRLACSRTRRLTAYWLLRRTVCWRRATVSRLWLKTSGSADEDDVDRLGAAVEVGGQHLDRRPGPGADGQDAAAEMLGAAVGQVVAGHRGDDDVLQAEPGARLGQAVGLVEGHGLGLAALARRRSRTAGCRRRPGS